MPIEFAPPKPVAQMQFMLQTVADNMMRPYSRYFDENEHEIPFSYIEFMHTAMKASGVGSIAPQGEPPQGQAADPKRPPIPLQPEVENVLHFGDASDHLALPAKAPRP